MAKKTKSKKGTKPETPVDAENMLADMVVKFGKPAIAALAIIMGVGIFMAVSGNEDGVDPKEAAASAELDGYVDLMKNEFFSYNEITDQELKNRVMDYSSVISNNKNTLAAADAGYYRAMAYFFSAKYEEAAKGFTKYFTEHGDRFPLATLARLGAAKSLMSIGSKEKVEEAVKIATLGRNSTPHKNFKNRFTYQLGICYILLGKKEAALKELTPLAKSKDMNPKIPPARSYEAAMLLPMVKGHDAKVLSEFLTGYPKSLVEQKPKVEKKDPEKPEPATKKKVGG